MNRKSVSLTVKVNGGIEVFAVSYDPFDFPGFIIVPFQVYKCETNDRMMTGLGGPFYILAHILADKPVRLDAHINPDNQLFLQVAFGIKAEIRRNWIKLFPWTEPGFEGREISFAINLNESAYKGEGSVHPAHINQEILYGIKLNPRVVGKPNLDIILRKQLINAVWEQTTESARSGELIPEFIYEIGTRIDEFYSTSTE